MRLEQVEGAFPGGLGGRLMVMFSAGPGKGVALALIIVNRHLVVALQRRADLRLLFGGHEFVLGGDMEDQRRVNRLAHVFRQHHPVIADGGVGLGPRRGQKRQPTAEAKPDGSHLAGTAIEDAQGFDGRIQILDPLVEVETVEQFERPGPFLLRLVGQPDARFLAPEKVGAKGHVAGLGEAVGKAAHDAVDAENLLDHHDPRAASRLRRRQIAHEIAAIGRVDGDFLAAHG